MAKYYIDRDALVEWLKRIPLKDLSDGLGLCRIIMEDDFKKAIKKMPKGIIVDVAPARHGHTVHDFDRRFQFEDEGLIDPKARFRWSMLDDDLQYTIFKD